MIPKRPEWLAPEDDSLHTLRAKVDWLAAYSALRVARYLAQHHAIARLVVGVLLLLVMGALALYLRGIPEPLFVGRQLQQQAFADWIIYIIILIVVLILSYALAPKPITPEPQKGRAPEATDGKSIIRPYGTIWVEDPMVLGFRTMGADPIKQKGGKK